MACRRHPACEVFSHRFGDRYAQRETLFGGGRLGLPKESVWNLQSGFHRASIVPHLCDQRRTEARLLALGRGHREILGRGSRRSKNLGDIQHTADRGVSAHQRRYIDDALFAQDSLGLLVSRFGDDLVAQ